MEMSESQKDKLSRFVAEAVEARQHQCGRCGHKGSDHVFDIVVTDDPNPCMRSCMVCMGMKKNEKPKKNTINLFPCSRCKRDPLFEVLIYNPKAGVDDRIYLCKKHLIKEGIPDKLLIFAGVIKKCQ